MIAPGWLPNVTRAPAKRRTLAYTRVRRSRPRNVAPQGAIGNPETMAFDHGPVEFPIATVVTRDPRALVGELVRWLAARWAWLKPRTVPVIAAAVGLVLVLASADYLSRDHGSHTHRVIVRTTSNPHTIVIR